MVLGVWASLFKGVGREGGEELIVSQCLNSAYLHWKIGNGGFDKKLFKPQPEV